MDIYIKILYDFLNAIFSYVKNNSIDFIAIMASIIIAIQTDKWIEHRKDKEQKKSLLIELPGEIRQLIGILEKDVITNRNNIQKDKLQLKLNPYETPLWDSVRNSDRINLLTGCNGYKETLLFYESIRQLNEWENLLTKFVLFANREIKENYQELLLAQIIEQREKSIFFAKVAIDKLEGEKADYGSTICME